MVIYFQVSAGMGWKRLSALYEIQTKTPYIHIWRKTMGRNPLRLQPIMNKWCRRPETFVPESFFVTYCFKETLAWFRALECTVLVLIPVPFLCTELQEGSHVQYDFRYLGGENAELGNEPASQFRPDFF